jgi:hypothetical protein
MYFEIVQVGLLAVKDGQRRSPIIEEHRWDDGIYTEVTTAYFYKMWIVIS